MTILFGGAALTQVNGSEENGPLGAERDFPLDVGDGNLPLQ